MMTQAIRDYIKIVEGTDQPAQKPGRAIMVYGSFKDPDTGKGFFIIRVPRGRVQWSKKIAPAINRIVTSMYSDEERKQDRYLRRMWREPLIYWNVEGDDPKGESFWDLKQTVTRYEWNGNELVKVAPPAG